MESAKAKYLAIISRCDVKLGVEMPNPELLKKSELFKKLAIYHWLTVESEREVPHRVKLYLLMRKKELLEQIMRELEND